MLLQVDRREDDDQRGAVAVMERSPPDPAAAGFAPPASDAVPLLEMLAAGEGVPMPLVDGRLDIPAWAPAGGFTGRVVSSTGQPLGAARLNVFGDVELKNLWFGFSRWPAPLAVAVSAADGTFSISRVPAGKPLVVRIDAPGGRLLVRWTVALPDEP
jgi:hypothetical protein